MLLVIGSAQLTAQQMNVSLQQLFELADTNNKKIAAERHKVDAANESWLAAQDRRLPSIELSATANYIANGYMWNREFSEGMSIDLPHFGNNFSLIVSQVLYAGGAISASVAAAELNKQIAMLDYEQNRQEIHLLIAGNYLELQKTLNHIVVFEQNIMLAQKLIDNIGKKHEQGVALKNDRTRYELQLENLKLQLQRLKNLKVTLNMQLCTAVGLESGISFIPSDDVLSFENKKDLSYWQEQADTSSLMLRMATLDVKMKKNNEKAEKSTLLPSVLLVAGNELQGPITFEIPTLDKNFNFMFAGVTIKYNIDALYKSHYKRRKAHFDTQHSQLQLEWMRQNIKDQIETTIIQQNEAYNEYCIETKKLQLAQQNYNVINERYNNQVALLTDMLDAGNTKLAAELDVINARINLAFMQLKLRYICGAL